MSPQLMAPISTMVNAVQSKNLFPIAASFSNLVINLKSCAYSMSINKKIIQAAFHGKFE